MFSSYNFNYFGFKVKNIRESMRYTQSDIQDICGIHPDTLRRIENGKTIPKYETLEILSDIYKVDLLSLLTKYRTSHKLYNYHDRLDYLISNFDIDILRNLKKDFENFMVNQEDVLVSPILYKQFELVLEGISKYNSTNGEERLSSLEFL